MTLREGLLLLLWLAGSGIGRGQSWYVGPAGEPGNPGTAERPWDIASALAGRQPVWPGDTVYLLDGTYRRRPNELFEVKLAGAADKPIRVRPAPGARARIDGGLVVQSPAAHLWVRELEIFVCEPLPERPVGPGSHPPDLKRPWGGMHMHGGKNCKYINLVIHNCNQGISCWKGEIDPEIYGCIIYENGWLGTDRGHGHCIYTQNDQGTKTISNCIMTAKYPGCYTMHAYGSARAYVNNFVIEQNICYGAGPVLVGGGRPSRNIRVLGNYLYNVPMRIGYTAPYNEDCLVRDNLIIDAGLTVTRYRNAVRRNNTVIEPGRQGRQQMISALLPNRYDPNRAHLVVYNPAGAASVEVPTEGFLADGDAFVLMDPKDIFGEPVHRGICSAGLLRAPTSGRFAVFVLIKSRYP